MGKHRDANPSCCPCGRPAFKHNGYECRMLQLRCWECGGMGHNRVDCPKPCHCCKSTEHNTIRCPSAVNTDNRNYLAEAMALPTETRVEFVATMLRLFSLESEQVLRVISERQPSSNATTVAAGVPSGSGTATATPFPSSPRGVKRGEEEIASLDDGSSPKRPCQEELGAKTFDPVSQAVTAASGVSAANVTGSQLPVPTKSLNRNDRVIAQSELSGQEKTQISPSVSAPLSAQVDDQIKSTISTPTSEKTDRTNLTAPSSTKTRPALPVKQTAPTTSAASIKTAAPVKTAALVKPTIQVKPGSLVKPTALPKLDPKQSPALTKQAGGVRSTAAGNQPNNFRGGGSRPLHPPKSSKLPRQSKGGHFDEYQWAPLYENLKRPALDWSVIPGNEEAVTVHSAKNGGARLCFGPDGVIYWYRSTSTLASFALAVQNGGLSPLCVEAEERKKQMATVGFWDPEADRLDHVPKRIPFGRNRPRLDLVPTYGPPIRHPVVGLASECADRYEALEWPAITPQAIGLSSPIVTSRVPKRGQNLCFGPEGIIYAYLRGDLREFQRAVRDGGLSPSIQDFEAHKKIMAAVGSWLPKSTPSLDAWPKRISYMKGEPQIKLDPKRPPFKKPPPPGTVTSDPNAAGRERDPSGVHSGYKITFEVKENYIPFSGDLPQYVHSYKWSCCGGGPNSDATCDRPGLKTVFF